MSAYKACYEWQHHINAPVDKTIFDSISVHILLMISEEDFHCHSDAENLGLNS